MEDTTFTIIKIDSLNDSYFGDEKPLSSELSTNDVIELNKFISDFIKDHKYELLDIKEYQKQYIPIINNSHEKEVIVNCFCNRSHTRNEWRKKLVLAIDGGNCYFHLKVNLHTKKYSEFGINNEG